MSITIKGVTSGGVDLKAPDTGSNTTVTLPSATGTLLPTDGNGSALTNLTSANLVGALPALSGANLTGLTSANLVGALPALDGSSLTGVGVSGIVSTANATAITIDSSERVGCGTTTPPYQLSIHESATASGTYFPMGITGGSHLTGYGVGLAFRSENTSTTQKAKCAIVGEGTGGGNNLTSLHICLNNVADTTTEVSLSDSKLEFTNDGRGLSQFTAKAWVNFNGTGNVAIRGSHNVSSIADRGTGNYTVNFSNNMANANYSTVGSTNDNNAGGLFYYTNQTGNVTGQPQSTSSILIASNGGNSGAIDADTVSVQVFGD